MPRDGSQTRERILATAEGLVIENGFAATSVDAVIAEAQTSKGAFFHHFESKQALADALVDRYVAADLDHLERALAVAASRRTARARLLAFLHFFEDGADALMAAQSSCLYASVLVERQLLDAGSGEPVRRAVEEWRAGYGDLLRRARPRAGNDEISDLADHLFATFEGAFLLARSTGDPGHMRRQMRIHRRLVERWLGPATTTRSAPSSARRSPATDARQ